MIVTFRFFLIGIIVICGLAACSTTKYVPDNAFLLNKIEIQNSAKDISKEELKFYLRQKENVKIIGFWRFHLGLYNLSGRDESNGFNQWLRRIGEEPVLYDDLLKQNSNEQLTLFLKNKGYFNAQVTDSVIQTRKKKVKLSFSINPGKQYRINNVHYRIDDDSLRQLVYADTLQSLLKNGQPFDAELHDKERERLTRLMRSKGYYNFSKEYIYYLADSALGNYRVNDSLILVKDRKDFANDADTLVAHRKSRIKDVFFLVGFDPQEALQNDSGYLSRFDTLMYEGCHILYGDNLNFRADVLINSNYIFPGQLYSADLVDKTQSLLSDLQLFRFIDIRFRELVGQKDAEGNKMLQCFIQLSPSRIQSYAFELEGTNSSGNLGAAGIVKYKHKNLLRGAEVFDMRFRTASENQANSDGEKRFNTLEVGVDAGLTLPKFVVPFKVEGFRKRFNPRTNVKVAYNYQRRPDYTRTIANSKLSYNWKSSRFVSHSFSPLEFSLVNIPVKDSAFWSRIENTTLKHSYTDHLIMNSSYTYLYNEQILPNEKQYWFFRANAEAAGNLLNGLVGLWDDGSDSEFREIMGIRYAQYVKADFDVRYHHIVNEVNSMAYRFFAGVGYPYGNMNTLPFEKRYFVGGANSIRAWPVRGLGPGAFKDTVSGYYNQIGDIRLELNAEYRFKLFWRLEGALFADIGNIWNIRKTGIEKQDEEGLFKFDQFYKQIAVGLGAGARLDFGYFVFRMDMGVKARDPSLPAGKRWVLGADAFNVNNMAFNFAIGYPF